MTFPFDGEDHKLHIGESYSGGLQYHSVKYDFKPPSIDFDKEGILESDGTKCKIRFPNRTTAEQNKKSTVYEGKIQEIEKECILIIDRKTNTITLERVTSKVSVRNSRERDDKTYDFPAKRTLDRSAVSVSRSSSSSRPAKVEKVKREPTLPVKKPRHELAAVKPKLEPDDLIMPSLSSVKSEPIHDTTNIIGLGGEGSIKKERKDVKTEPSSIFSPDVNSESSSNSSSSDDSDDNDSDESSDQESDRSPKQETTPGDNTKEDLLNELYLSDSESDSDSN